MHNVIHDSAIIPKRSQKHPFPPPPLSLSFFLHRPSIIILRRFLPNPIKNLRESPQRPLLQQVRRQHPLPLHLDLVILHPSLQLFTLLIRMHIYPLGRQSRYQRPWERLLGEGRVRVDAEACPGVLVLEIVEGLEGEGVQVGGVSGWGVV